MRYSQPYHDAVAIQRVLKGDIDNSATKPSDRAQLARAWDALEERKRVMKMRPKPKDVDVSKPDKPKTIRTVQFSEV